MLKRDITKILDFPANFVRFSDIPSQHIEAIGEHELAKLRVEELHEIKVEPRHHEALAKLFRAQWDEERPHFNHAAGHRYDPMNGRRRERYCSYCGKPDDYAPRTKPSKVEPDERMVNLGMQFEDKMRRLGKIG